MPVPLIEWRSAASGQAWHYDLVCRGRVLDADVPMDAPGRVAKAVRKAKAMRKAAKLAKKGKG